MRHGGDIDEAARLHGGDGGQWLDLSTGVNPRPYPLEGATDLASTLTRLPSAQGLERLLDAARRAYGVPADVPIMAAPGTEILIRALPAIAAGPVLLASTSYRSYAESFATAGRLSTVGVAAALAAEPEASVVIVSPNNPDGAATDPWRILALARSRAAERIVVVDEAYCDAEPQASVLPHLRAGDPVVVLKSFGKFFGLPGLRLGFAAGAAAAIETLRAAIGDWPVSGAGIAIGVAALGDEAWHRQTRHWLGNQAQALDAVIRRAGLGSADGCRLFRIVRVGDAPAVHERLARQFIWTRVFEDQPDLIRFGLPPSAGDLKRLAAALGP